MSINLMIEHEYLNFGFEQMDIDHRTSLDLLNFLNRLEHVHLLVMELKHPIFGFERSNIEIRT